MTTTLDARAGHALPHDALLDVPRLMTAYYTGKPDPAVAAQRVAFGTSGHRGSAFALAFNEGHILAVSQAVCLYRRAKGIDGPLFLGIDTHALSRAAYVSALEVFTANAVAVHVDADDGYTPTPLISHAILSHNRGRDRGLADGVVITPSHNPPEDGGYKYNPPSGGPADTDATAWIEAKANEILADGLRAVRRLPLARALASGHVHRHDYIGAYVADLAHVVDLDAIRASGVRLGVDPLGGAGLATWQAVIERHGLAATIVNREVDATFRFMPADWDGRIRMDCSSAPAMARLIGMRDRFDVAVANDTDADRHGIVTASHGLLNPNHYLAVAIDHLFRHRPGWPQGCGVGKTMVSSAIIDRVAARLGRPLVEVPVGFKWFVDGLLSGALGFGGEESAGASFLRRDATVWTTDKDGILLSLLAAEMTAVSGRNPGEAYAALTAELGAPAYARIDAPASAAQKKVLKGLRPEDMERALGGHLAGDPVTATLTTAPANGQPFGGIKVATARGWFAARPSGTEEVYKIYAESFEGKAHLRRIQQDAQAAISGLFEG